MWLGKAAYYISFPALYIMSLSISKRRVRVLVRAQSGQILLVKTWFGRQRWSLPGGGIESGESPEQAAIRELREETGIIVDHTALVRLGEHTQPDGLPFHLIFFMCEVPNTTLDELKLPYKYEIIGRRWVSTQALPANISSAVAWALSQAQLLSD